MSRLRVTIPRQIAARFGIRPGDEVEWISDGSGIRLELVARQRPLGVAERLKLFDEGVDRQRERERLAKLIEQRGWSREDLYDRRGPR